MLKPPGGFGGPHDPCGNPAAPVGRRSFRNSARPAGATYIPDAGVLIDPDTLVSETAAPLPHRRRPAGAALAPSGAAPPAPSASVAITGGAEQAAAASSSKMAPRCHWTIWKQKPGGPVLGMAAGAAPHRARAASIPWIVIAGNAAPW
jgi:hypothetical protein